MVIGIVIVTRVIVRIVIVRIVIGIVITITITTLVIDRSMHDLYFYQPFYEDIMGLHGITWNMAGRVFCVILLFFFR